MVSCWTVNDCVKGMQWNVSYDFCVCGCSINSTDVSMHNNSSTPLFTDHNIATIYGLPWIHVTKPVLHI